MRVTPRVLFNHTSTKATRYKSKILAGISAVIESGTFLQGSQNTVLIQRLSKYFKTPLVTTVASGHDALGLALGALSLTDTDEVIVQANAYPTAFPVALSKARLVLCDVTANAQIDPDQLAKAITKRTRAIIMVHMYGLVGDLQKIQNIARQHNVLLIEDCAQAFGSLYKGKPVGSYGDISCLSFYPTKNLGTLGDGGAILTKHKTIHAYVQQAKAYGEHSRYESNFVAGHSRLPEIQAAILNVYWKDIEKDLDKRRKLMAYFRQCLSTHKLDNYIGIFTSDLESHPAPHILVITTAKRDALRSFLAKQGIETHIHYPVPIHNVRAFAYLGYKKGDFPVAETLAKSKLSLPFHQYMTRDHIAYIIRVLGQFFHGKKNS